MCNNHIHLPKDASAHDREHIVWSRRSFLQALGIAGSGTMMLGSNLLSASAPSPLTAAIANAPGDGILILIRLSGGNDGLSTVIPIEQYDTYANARPNIYIPESKILKLTDEFGIPSYMQSLESMWGNGAFKAVHGVGYQNQSLSHFTGSDIFANTDLTTTNTTGERTGWMGRYFENLYPDYLINPPAAPAAIQIGQYGNLVFQGTADGRFLAFNAQNGEQLWESPVGSGIVAAPVTYEVDGKQYVSIAVGWGGAYGEYQRATGMRDPGRVYTYALGGDAALPENTPYPMEPLLAGVEHDPADFQQGMLLYMSNCAICHGAPGLDPGGSIRNLAYVSTATIENLDAMVFNGPFVQRGMPDFTGRLTTDDVSKIKAFIQGMADSVRPQ